MVIGAPTYNWISGRVYVYEKTGGVWQKALHIDTPQGGSFGYSVSHDGDRLLVGAPRANRAYVYNKLADGLWHLDQEFIPPYYDYWTYQFASVSVRGDRLLLGSKYLKSAYVYELGTYNWVLTATLQATDSEAANEPFGDCVELLGERAIVASPPFNATTGNGAVRVFDRQIDGTWVQVAKIASPKFGQYGDPRDFVAASGDRIVVGAALDYPTPVVGSGGAYVYRVCDACLASFGTGTFGCAGAHSLNSSFAPESGLQSFSISCDLAPPSSMGLLLLGDAASIAGSDPFGLGVLLHVDLLASAELLALDLVSDAQGSASAFAPIPPAPGLVGTTWHACALWAWSGTCALPGLGLSSTPGLSITILAP
jgi:hypothetical protein